MVSLLLKNIMYIITMGSKREMIKDGAIVVDGNRIIDIGKSEDITRKYNADDVIDAEKKIALPGFVNVHTHSGSAINRGVSDDFPNVLSTIFLPLGAQQTKEDRVKIARAALLDDVMYGTTCVGDDIYLAEEVKRLGLRGVLNLRVADANTSSPDFAEKMRYEYRPDVGIKQLKDGIELLKTWDKRSDGMITTHLGPHAPDYCSRELLDEVIQQSVNLDKDLTIHLAQSSVELQQIRSLYGVTPVEFLDSLGFFERKVYAAHCMYVTRHDLEILAKRGVKICHSPLNMARLYSIIAPLQEWLESGLTVGLCTDGASNGDMIETARASLALQRARLGQVHPHYTVSGGAPPYPMKMLEMMTVDAAKVVGLEEQIGSLEVGKKADIILIDTKKPHLTPMINPIGSIIHYGFGSDVDTSIIDGKVRMKNRVAQGIDVEKILSEAQDAGIRTYKKFQDAFSSHVKRYGMYHLDAD